MLKVNPAETLVRHGDTVLGTHRPAVPSAFGLDVITANI
jgi:hypothetical protein